MAIPILYVAVVQVYYCMYYAEAGKVESRRSCDAKDSKDGERSKEKVEWRIDLASEREKYGSIFFVFLLLEAWGIYCCLGSSMYI